MNDSEDVKYQSELEERLPEEVISYFKKYYPSLDTNKMQRYAYELYWEHNEKYSSRYRLHENIKEDLPEYNDKFKFYGELKWNDAQTYQQAFTNITNADVSNSTKLYLMLGLLNGTRTGAPDLHHALLERFRKETGFYGFDDVQHEPVRDGIWKDPEIRSEDTLISLAEDGRSVALAQYLKKTNEDINAIQKGRYYGYTALHATVQAGDVKTVALLLRDSRIDANAKTLNDERTPLMIALDVAGNEATPEQQEIINLLKNCSKTDLNAIDEQGVSVWLHAARAGNISYLQDTKDKVNPNHCDKMGRNAIHYSLGKPDQMQMLIEMGVDVMARDDDGRTVFDKAQYVKNSKSIMQILTIAGYRIPDENHTRTYGTGHRIDKNITEETISVIDRHLKGER